MQNLDYNSFAASADRLEPLPGAPGRWRELGISLLVGLAMVWYYQWLLLDLHVVLDVQGHLDYLGLVCRRGYTWPANPGFHWLTWQLAGHNCDEFRLLHVGTWALGLCWGATTYLAIWAGQQLLRSEAATAGESPARRAWTTATVAIVAALASSLVFPPPANLLAGGSFRYLGLLPPNVYHNSTLVGAMPFAIAALSLGLRQLRGPRHFGLDALLGLVLAAGALFKPSFAFAFVPAYGICRLLHGRRALGRHLLGLGLVAGPVLLVIAGQTWWIAKYPEVSIGAKSTFAFSLPAGWKLFMPWLPAGRALLLALGSFALPLLAYALRPDWLTKPAHQLLVLSTAFAFIQFMLVHETGERATHGNFTWQVMAANHWLYWLVVLEALHWRARTKAERIKQTILVSAIGLSIASGIVYMSQIGLTQTYF